MLERDLEQCSGIVALQIPRAPSIPRSMGTITGSAGAYPIVVDTGGAQGADALDRLQREEALLSSCMNGKGYARVSASEANRK